MSFIITQLARKASITNKHQELREGENLIMSPLVFQKIVTSTIYYVWATHFSNTTLDCQEIRSHVAFFFLSPPSNDAESLCRWIYHRELYADTLLVTQADICPFCLWSHLSVDYKRKTAPCCVSIRRATSLHLLDGNFWELVFVYARQSERRCVCVCRCAQADGGVVSVWNDGTRWLSANRSSIGCSLYLAGWGVAGATSSVSGGVENEYSAVITNVSALTRTPPLWWAKPRWCKATHSHILLHCDELCR